MISLSHSFSGFDGEAASLETSVIDAARVFFLDVSGRTGGGYPLGMSGFHTSVLVSFSESERITFALKAPEPGHPAQKALFNS